MNRFVLAGAVGAGVFALAGAGAAALNSGGATSGQVVQQTNALTATCAPDTVNFNDVVSNQNLDSLRIFQQDVEGHGKTTGNHCDGAWVQGVIKMDNGALVYTTKVWIPTSNVTNASQLWFLPKGSNPATYGDAVYGIDLNPQVPSGVCAAHVASTVLTIAGQINGPGTTTTGDVVGTLPTCGNDNFFTTPS